MVFALAACSGSSSKPKDLPYPTAGANANRVRAEAHQDLSDALSTSSPSLHYKLVDDTDTECLDAVDRSTGQLELKTYVTFDGVTLEQQAGIIERFVDYWKQRGFMVDTRKPITDGGGPLLSVTKGQIGMIGYVGPDGSARLGSDSGCVKP
jgi:hypothetical protein